jgi:hypothetical protein
VVVRDPVTTRPDVTLGEFMDDIARTTRYATYPVTDNGHVVGLLPPPVAEVPRSEWETRTVRDCMPAREDPGRARGRRSLRRGGRVLGRRPRARSSSTATASSGSSSWSDVRRA